VVSGNIFREGIHQRHTDLDYQQGRNDPDNKAVVLKNCVSVGYELRHLPSNEDPQGKPGASSFLDGVSS
jgi:hypothetical protein